MNAKKIVVGIVVFLLANTVYAADLLVPGQYSTIQAAINVASTGDTIIVDTGAYHENINFWGKAITVRSIDPNDPNETVIDGSSSPGEPAIKFDGGQSLNMELKGFTVKNGSYGIWCYYSNPTISNCIIEDYTDAGIYHTGPPPGVTIKNSTIQHNNSGICIEYGSATIRNNHIYGNTYGVFAKEGSTVNIRDNRIYGNGEGIFGIPYSSAVIENNWIYNNGEGIFTRTYSSATIRNNLIYGNGTGVYAEIGSPVIISNNTIVDNANYGIVGFYGTSTIYNCILWGNGDDLSGCSAAYSCIEDGDVGVGNISSYPYFADYASDDFHLTWNSQCINRGADGNYAGQYDIDGEDRVAEEEFVNERIDIGADELNLHNINLVKNPGFEGGVDASGIPLHWIKGDVYSCLIDSDEKHSGNYSWKFTNDGNHWNNVSTEPIYVEFGRTYKLAAWTKCASTTKKTTLGWEGFDADSNSTAEKFFLKCISPGLVPWTPYAGLRAIRNKNTKYIKVGLSSPEQTTGTVWWDDFSLTENVDFLPPYGCENEVNVVKSLDLGASNDDNPNYNGGIVWNTSSMGDRHTDLVDENIHYRVTKSNSYMVIEFPAFNVDPNDANGLPLTPMLLEIMCKDTTDGTGFTVKSKIGYINPDPCYGITDPNDRDKYIAHLGDCNDGRWKYIQYAFQKSDFQLLRAIKGKFTIKIASPWYAAGIPIDYISLRAISQEEYEAFANKQRAMRGFYEIEMPANNPDNPSYTDPNLTVFVRDIMHPVYRHTKPGVNEPNKISTFSSWGEVEPACFSIYSENGVNDVNITVSNLTCADGNAIDGNKIFIYHVVYDEKRVADFSDIFSYALLPDRIVEFNSLSIEPNTSESVWLKINVPKENVGLTAGLYTGQVTIARAGGPNVYVPINFNVYDITLDEPNYINPVCSDSWSSLSSDLDTVYKAVSETGFEPFDTYTIDIAISLISVTKDPNDANSRIDPNNLIFETTTFKNSIGRSRAKGFLKNYALIQTTNQWYFGFGELYKLVMGKVFDGSDLNLWNNLSDPNLVKGFGMLIDKYTEIGDACNITFIHFLADEPGSDHPDRRIIADRLGTIVHAHNGLTAVTYYPDCDEKCSPNNYIIDTNDGLIPPLTDLVDYKIWPIASDWIEEGYAKHQNPDYYGHFGYYTTHYSQLRNPVYNRFLHGLLAFRTGAEIVYDWKMGSGENDPYNDFDSGGSDIDPVKYPIKYPDFIYAYPSWNGELLYTIGGIETIREGIKDSRYIATLERFIEENSSNTVAYIAQEYLDGLKDRVDPNYNQAYKDQSTELGYYAAILKKISQYNDVDDYEAFTRIRRDIAEYIVLLSSLASQPNPADEAVDIDTDATLSWTVGKCALSYDVYLGTGYSDVTDANKSSPEYKGSQDGNSFNPNGLEYSTTYYWRIDSNSVSGVAKGNVWSFTTVPDTTAPTPNPLVWASVPRSASSTSITMMATTATDASPPVQYYFECTTDVSKSSGWQTSTTYIATGLTTGTAYTFRVKARDSAPAQNETGWSETGTAMPVTLTYIAAGTVASGTGNITVPWPSHQAGDVAILFIESCGGQAANLGTPAGFAAVANSPQSTGTGTAGTRITAYWCRATSSSMTSPVVTDPGDHVYGRILTFRGVTATGDPWDVTAGGIKSTASTTTTFGAVTTTVNDTLIVLAASRDNDSSLAAWSNWTNANLSGLTERSDGGTSSSNGGGIGVATGVKSTAGSTGTTTASVTSSVDGHLTIALKPADGVIVPPGQASNPTPTNGAANVSVTQDLSWTAGIGATSHDVYFGTTDPPAFLQNQAGTTFDAGMMEYNTTYYWRIDEKSAGGTATGAVWSFTTATGGEPVVLLQDGFETNFDKWTDGGATDWDRATNQKHSGSYSAHAGSSDNDLISDNMNTTGKSSIRIEFWFRDDDIDDYDNIYLQLYNGSTYVNYFELDSETEDTWIHYTDTITDSQYMRSDFRIKFEGTSIDYGENLWIDDVNVTAQ